MISAEGMRRRKRVQKNCDVEFYANDEAYRGAADNFSIDGLFIKTDNLLDTHSVISIIVYLPDGSASKVKGMVRQVVKTCNDAVMDVSQQTFKGGMGIELIERDPKYVSFFLSLLCSPKF
jgi:hypothetical protein